MPALSRGQALLQEIRRRIVLNELRPGSVLTELSLAAELRGSQGAVREALLRLEGEGLVTRSGHQGTTVTDLGSAEATQILLLRREIEGRAAALVALRLNRGDEAALEALSDVMASAAATGSQWDMIVADTNFT